MDRLSDMRLLIDAAELGSFTAAARRHALSPAAASARILRLEARLGARLFERTTRRLRLTDDGRLYLDHCRRALEVMESAARAVGAGQDQVQGVLRLSAPSDLGRNLLLEMTDGFMRAHPEVRLVLTLSDSLSNLVLDEQDLAIRVGRLPDSSLIARRLADSRRVVCASPACLERYGRPATPAQLAEAPTLALVTAAGAQTQWRLGDETVRVRPRHESNDSEVIRKWALQGHGFAYRQIWAVIDDVRAGRLCLVQPQAWFAPSPINALYHQHTYQPPRLKRLLDWLQTEFAARAQAWAPALAADAAAGHRAGEEGARPQSGWEDEGP